MTINIGENLSIVLGKQNKSVIMHLLNQLKVLFNDASITIEEEVQSLWSGYGQIVRCKSQVANHYYIVKVIVPSKANDHPRGWGSAIAHQRKLTSYQVESSFYQHYADLTDQYCKVPKLFHASVEEKQILLVMEDLNHTGYNLRKKDAKWHDIVPAIKWLAYFHACFMNREVNRLWPTGTYWHLATRQDEFLAMPDSEYKDKASVIDSVLNKANFKTLVHGDAKFENLCFHSNGKQVAAVDFQYAGQGTGVKDLAYLVGSCLTNEQLFEYDSLIIDEYLLHLNQALRHYHVVLDTDALNEEVRRLYPVAWADFYRFLLGWNPNSWKMNEFMQIKSKEGLELL